MFAATLFIITKSKKQLVNKINLHIMEHYSAIKRNKLLTHVMSWMNVRSLPSKRIQVQKNMCSVILFI